jgi:recyclin-1
MYRSKTGAANRGSILSTLKATEMLDTKASLPAGMQDTMFAIPSACD